MRSNLRRRPAPDALCVGCGGELDDGDVGYTGWLVYHRPCARRAYGALFIESETAT